MTWEESPAAEPCTSSTRLLVVEEINRRIVDDFADASLETPNPQGGSMAAGPEFGGAAPLSSLRPQDAGHGDQCWPA